MSQQSQGFDVKGTYVSRHIATSVSVMGAGKATRHFFRSVSGKGAGKAPRHIVHVRLLISETIRHQTWGRMKRHKANSEEVEVEGLDVDTYYFCYSILKTM